MKIKKNGTLNEKPKKMMGKIKNILSKFSLIFVYLLLLIINLLLYFYTVHSQNIHVYDDAITTGIWILTNGHLQFAYIGIIIIAFTLLAICASIVITIKVETKSTFSKIYIFFILAMSIIVLIYAIVFSAPYANLNEVNSLFTYIYTDHYIFFITLKGIFLKWGIVSFLILISISMIITSILIFCKKL